MPARADIQDIRSSDNEIWAAAGAGFFNYKEPAAKPNLPDSEHGTLPSLAAGASMMTPEQRVGWRATCIFLWKARGNLATPIITAPISIFLHTLARYD